MLSFARHVTVPKVSMLLNQLAGSRTWRFNTANTRAALNRSPPPAPPYHPVLSPPYHPVPLTPLSPCALHPLSPCALTPLSPCALHPLSPCAPHLLITLCPPPLITLCPPPLFTLCTPPQHSSCQLLMQLPRHNSVCTTFPRYMRSPSSYNLFR
jgi:hypothetical protein